MCTNGHLEERTISIGVIMLEIQPEFERLRHHRVYMVYEKRWLVTIVQYGFVHRPISDVHIIFRLNKYYDPIASLHTVCETLFGRS